MKEERPHRKEQISELLHHEVAEAILRSFDFGETVVTVTAVVLSPNRQQAKIYVSVFPIEKSEEVLKSLVAKIVVVQKELNKNLRIRPVPKIEFVADDSEEVRRRLLDIIDRESIDNYFNNLRKYLGKVKFNQFRDEIYFKLIVG